MTREEITGKFLALATKCENKHDTMDLTLDLLEEYSNDFESRTCEWEVDEDTTYSTSCHNLWQFTEGGLTDNEIKFCPFCGSKIVSTDTKENK